MNAATPSSACLALVKRFEGFRAEPLALGDGAWLVGHGHVSNAPPAQLIGETEAEYLLKEDLEEVCQVLRRAVPNGLTQSQFDALASFGFSIGVDALERSDVLALVSEARIGEAAAALAAWRVSGVSGSLAAVLARRREAEKAMLLAGEDIGAAASAPPLSTHEMPAEPGAVAPLPPRQPEKADVLGLVALGVLGLLLIAMGVTGADDDNGVAYLVFAAPGAVGVAMSVYYLLKKTVEAV